MSALVSVIVPAYNVDKYIFRAIDSVLNQTYKNIELIIVDDGSTDSTWEIIEEYKKKDLRIKTERQENKGVSSARNKALKMVEGKFVLFLDADDWLESNAIEILLMHHKSGHMVACERYFVYMRDDGLEKIPQAKRNSKPEFVRKETALINIGTGKYNLQSSCYKLFDVEIIKKTKLEFSCDIYNGEDGLFVYQYLEKIKGVIYITDMLWNILERNDSATMQAYNKKFLTAIIAVEKMIEMNGQKSEEVKKALNLYMVERSIMVENRALRMKKIPAKDVIFIRNKIRLQLSKEYDFIGRHLIRAYFYAYCPIKIIHILIWGKNKLFEKRA